MPNGRIALKQPRVQKATRPGHGLYRYPAGEEERRLAPGEAARRLTGRRNVPCPRRGAAGSGSPCCGSPICGIGAEAYPAPAMEGAPAGCRLAGPLACLPKSSVPPALLPCGSLSPFCTCTCRTIRYPCRKVSLRPLLHLESRHGIPNGAVPAGLPVWRVILAGR